MTAATWLVHSAADLNHPTLACVSISKKSKIWKHMSSKRKNNKAQTWLVIGACVLIALLLVWLTMADLWGDTDVAAMIAPVAL